MKCKKHDTPMEMAPGGHFYFPDCEAEQPWCDSEDCYVVGCEGMQGDMDYRDGVWHCGICGAVQ